MHVGLKLDSQTPMSCVSICFIHAPAITRERQCCKIVVNKLQRKVESRQVLNHPSTLLFETRLLLDLEWIGLEG